MPIFPQDVAARIPSRGTLQPLPLSTFTDVARFLLQQTTPHQKTSLKSYKPLNHHANISSLLIDVSKSCGRSKVSFCVKLQISSYNLLPKPLPREPSLRTLRLWRKSFRVVNFHILSVPRKGTTIRGYSPESLSAKPA